MINAKIIGDTALYEKLLRESTEVRQATEKGLARALMRLLAYIKGSKLSGQVLKAQTGRGRRSINQRIAETGAGFDGYVGTNVDYMAAHEQGGTQTVKTHLRMVKQAWGKTLKTPVWATVSAHQRTVPERSFLRTALRDLETEIVHDLSASINQVVGA